MQTTTTVFNPVLLRRLSTLSGLYAFLAGLISFCGWAFDVPRLTDWFNAGVSIQPNTAILIAIAGIAVLLLQTGYKRIRLSLGGFVAFAGAINLLQYLVDADFGFNDLLLFDRTWGYAATVSPGRFGPPASVSFMLIGASLVLLSLRDTVTRRYVPIISLVVLLLMTFSLLGYLFDARDFYAIPSFSAIALPTATMLMALALSLVVSVPEHHPMLLICERSSAGAMARTVLPILIIMIPLVTLLRVVGYENLLFDMGTSRALGAAVLLLGVIAVMWVALLALRRRDQSEREADQRKDEFLALLAHELRNPLAPISNAVSILKLTYNNREESERATEMISRQLSQLMRLIDDLLDVSRVTRGRMELRRERVELAPIIDLAITDYANHDITVTLPPHPIYLDADPIRLYQVFSNLLNNVCKFVVQPGWVRITVEQQGGDVMISIKDNGIGISSNKLEYIFEMFTQVDQSLVRSQGGLGIGLALARMLIEQHSGSIEARSDGLGRGSEFIIRLPIAINQTSPTQSGENEI